MGRWQKKRKTLRKSDKKRQTQPVGLAPGTPVYIGEERAEKVKITVINYDQDLLTTHVVETVEDCLPYKDQPTITWINVDGIHDAALVEKLGTYYGLHPLVLEDILNTQQRLKVDVFEDYMLVILRMHTYKESSQAIDIEQVSLVLGKNFVITFQEKEGDVFDPLRNRLRNNKGRVRKAGADYLAYSLLDAIVDSYFEIIDRFEEQIEEIDATLMSEPQPQIPYTIHILKRDLLFLRKSVWPLRSMVNELIHQGTVLIEQNTQLYLRDLYDHVIQIIDNIEIFRDILTGILDVYLSSISNKMNEIMKFLTIIGTIFIPLTFIAGVYGMNFHYMPELTWKGGYFLIWGVMIGIGVGLLAYFKKKRWL